MRELLSIPYAELCMRNEPRLQWQKMSLQKLQEASQTAALGCSDTPHHALTPCLRRGQLKSRALTWQCCIHSSRKHPGQATEMPRWGNAVILPRIHSTRVLLMRSKRAMCCSRSVRRCKQLAGRKLESQQPSPPWAPPDTRCCGAGAHSIPRAHYEALSEPPSTAAPASDLG